MPRLGAKIFLGLFSLMFLFALTPSAQAVIQNCFCYNNKEGDGCFFQEASDATTCSKICEQYYKTELVLAQFTNPTESEYATVIDTCVKRMDAARADETRTPIPAIIPDLNVDIPGLKFSAVVEDGGYVVVNFIGDYLNALLNWLIPSSIVAAAVMIIVGGIEYMIMSGVGQISQAKKRIQGALIGLVLLLGSYIMLDVVNPQLMIIEPISLEHIQTTSLEDILNSGDVSGEITVEDLDQIGIVCPRTGGSAAVADIARQFLGKVTYRMGGKGKIGKSTTFKWDKRTCQKDNMCCEQSPTGTCAEFCPEDTICLDCSGYAGVVAMCAGLPARKVSSNTAGMFPDAPRILTCESTALIISLELVKDKFFAFPYPLQPGDFLGWARLDTKKCKDYMKCLEDRLKEGKDADGAKSACKSLEDPCKKESGHVVTYIGDGKIIHSQSGGRNAGKGVTEEGWKAFCDRYKDKYEITMRVIPIVNLPGFTPAK